MKLILPDLRQTTGYTCGLTCARIIYDFLGVRGKLPAATPHDGTDPMALESAFRVSGLSVQSGTMDLRDLWHHTRQGRPVVCLVTYQGCGHYVVVGGVERNRVHYQCPEIGPSAEYASEFEKKWQDLSHRWGHDFKHHGVAVWV